METGLLKVERILKARGIRINHERILEHQNQGLMSKVFIVDSNKGQLILHLGKMSAEQKRQKIWDKIHGISVLFLKYPKIPVARVLAAGSFGCEYFIVQTRLPGKAAGKRWLKNNQVVDTWYISRRHLEFEIMKLLVLINNISILGAGWLVMKKGRLSGMYKNWQEFLSSETRLWIRGINIKEPSSTLGKKLKKYFQKVKNQVVYNKSFLLHNDLVNPSNILVKGHKILGLIDWEWSLAGDPAWEFAFNNKYALNSHVKKRAKIYEIFYLAWGLYIHANDTDPKIYNALRKHLAKSLR